MLVVGDSMADITPLQLDKKTWNKWSFYINLIIFIIIAVFIYLLIRDTFEAGRISASSPNDSFDISNAWLMIVRDVAFLAAGLVIIFFQLFSYYRQIIRRAW